MKILIGSLVISSILSLLSQVSLAESAGFQTPSGNIACEVIEGHEISLRCEIASSLQPKPPQPYAGYCRFDWGKGLLLPMSGRPEILCISDTVADPHKSILPYGSKWKNRGLKCLSEKAGLTCNNATGQGFFLSREKWRVFDKSGY